jgi:hypothetical protein
MNFQLASIIALSICLSFNELNHSVLAVSPPVSFSLENIVDHPGHHPTAGFDINSTDYYSDGKILNATIWLPSHLSRTGLRFGMNITIGGSEKPPVYYDMYLQNEYNGSLTSHITQRTMISPPDVEKPQYANRSLDKLDAFTGTYDKANRFVDLSLNLVSIGSPHHYFINFYLANGSKVLAVTEPDGVPTYPCQPDSLGCVVAKMPPSATVTAGGPPVSVPIIIEPGNSTKYLQDSANYYNETYQVNLTSKTGPLIRLKSTPVTVPILPWQQKVSDVSITVLNKMQSGNISLPLYERFNSSTGDTDVPCIF